MDTVGAYEAKTHLPRLLARVAKGEKLIITKHGVPVAVLAPYVEPDRPDAQEIVDQLRVFRKRRRLRGLSLKELIQEGRK